MRGFPENLAADQRERSFGNIVQWISPPDPWTNHDSALKQREPGTGNWLLQSDQYRRWKTGSLRHLWLHGKAGCGKTVLCSTAIEDVRAHCQDRPDAIYAMFYFSSGSTKKQRCDDLIRSLVAQLAWKDPACSMLRAAHNRLNRSSPGPNDLKRILLSALGSWREIFIVIDALDECPRDGDARQNMLEFLAEVSREARNVRILATSRYALDVRESMKTLKAYPLFITVRDVDVDIRSYVSSQLSRDYRLSRFDRETKALIQKTISDKADGMFQWARCQLQELKRLRSTKKSYVEAALCSPFAPLDELYELTLSGIEDGLLEEALALLRWLAYARSPLSIDQLAETSIIEPGNGSQFATPVHWHDRGALEDTLEILSDLVTIDETQLDEDHFRDGDSGSLISMKSEFDNDSIELAWDRQRVRKDTNVRLVHPSLKEFLESPRILSSAAKKFRLDNVHDHGFLVDCSLTYLERYIGSDGRSRTKQDFVTFPLLQYAAQSWFYHSGICPSPDMARERALFAYGPIFWEWLHIHQPDRVEKEPFSDPRYDYWGELPLPEGSALYYASFMGLDHSLRCLLSERPKINTETGMYGNALQAACVGGHEEIVRTLTGHGADVNASGGYYGNALQAACVGGHEEIVRTLLRCGAKVNAREGYYDDALRAAVSNRGNEAVVRMLIDSNANVNAGDDSDCSILEAAMSVGGNQKVVWMLLDAGARADRKNSGNDDAQSAATSTEDVDETMETLESGRTFGRTYDCIGRRYGRTGWNNKFAWKDGFGTSCQRP